MKSKNPIILCHAACTGGSLIYRLIASSFGFIGISEVSHKYNFRSTSFLPFDPEAQLYLQGIIDADEFSDIFFKRVCRCNDIFFKMGKIMLIREHSHSYFFNINKPNDIDSVSWIEGRYRKIYKESPWCLFSVRDPIDSWLGLRQSFPNIVIKDFNTYCEMYMNLLCLSEKTENLFMFKYEEMVRYPENTLSEISKKINIPFSSIEIEKINSIQSSGNSGRCSSELYIRPRRPFTHHLLDAANNSPAYKELCKHIGYVPLQEQIKFKERILMVSYKLNNFYLRIFNFLRKRFEVREVLD